MMQPARDLAVPPSLPKEIYERDFNIRPENSDIMQWYDSSVSIRKSRIRASISDENVWTLMDSYIHFFRNPAINFFNSFVMIFKDISQNKVHSEFLGKMEQRYREKQDS